MESIFDFAKVIMGIIAAITDFVNGIKFSDWVR